MTVGPSERITVPDAILAFWQQSAASEAVLTVFDGAGLTLAALRLSGGLSQK
jgi:hypothetical protein